MILSSIIVTAFRAVFSGQLKIFTSKYVLLNLAAQNLLALMSNLALSSVVVVLPAKNPLAPAEDEVRIAT